MRLVGVLALSAVDAHVQLKALHCWSGVCSFGCVAAWHGALLPWTDCVCGVSSHPLCTAHPAVLSHCSGLQQAIVLFKDLGEHAIGGA
jgi:hypothetical protein